MNLPRPRRNLNKIACADERQRVRRQLEQYFGRDTDGMVWIVDALRKLAD